MNPYENGVIKYQIALEKYKNGIANEVIRLLDNANIEIAGYIKKTQSVATKARYKQIAKKLNEISKQLKERIEQNIDVDAVIAYELKKENKLFETIKKVLHKGDAGKISFVYPNVEQIKTSALFRPATDGLTYQSYLDGVEAGLFNTWDSAVRTGYLTGIPTKQIVSNVMGGISQIDKLKKAGQIEPLRNAVYGNTRTLLQSFAEEARERVYKDNEQYFGDGEYKYEYLATLDARTCLVCGNYDGKKFKSLEDAPHVPQHRNCRCLIIPYFYIEGDTRASKDGQVKASTDFATWLDEQDEKTQREVLGATRFRMYQDGVKIEQFVDNGETLTLDELYERGLLSRDDSRKMSMSQDATQYRNEHIINNPMAKEDFEKTVEYFKNEYNIQIDSDMIKLNKDNTERLFNDIDTALKNNPKVQNVIRKIRAVEDDSMFMQQNKSAFEINKKMFMTDSNYLNDYLTNSAKAKKIPKNPTLYSCVEHEMTHFYEKLFGKNFVKEVYEKTVQEYARGFVGSKQEFMIHFVNELKDISRDIFSTSLNYSELVAYCRQDFIANGINSSNYSKLVYNEFTRKINENSK